MDLFKLFRRNRSTELAITSRASVKEDESDDYASPRETSRTKSSHDLIVESIQRFRNDFQSVEQQLRHEHEEAVADAKAKIAAAESLVTETGIDHALLILLREMWHWPSWCKREDFEKHKNLNATDVSGEEEETEKEEIKRIFFKYSGEPYCFEFTADKGYFDGTKWGRIVLYSANTCLVSLRVYHDLDRHREYYQWSKLSVDGLLPGPWISHVVEMEAKIELSEERWIAEIERKRLIDQAKGLPDVEP